jgi:hypothetical protein
VHKALQKESQVMRMLTVKLAGGSAGPMIDGVGRTTMNSGDVL